MELIYLSQTDVESLGMAMREVLDALDYDSAWTSAAVRECDKFCSDDVGQLLATKEHGVYFGGIPATIGADLDDMVTAKVLYERALERGAGVRLPL